MTNMADRIKKNSAEDDSEKVVRQTASNREHSKSNPARSFRLPPHTLTQMEEIRVAEQQDKGRIPTTTEVVIRAIEELHQRSSRK